jgi:NAD(P)-dependent dehydrogenase (short-subunit alcohol dehydrogenase family)
MPGNLNRIVCANVLNQQQLWCIHNCLQVVAISSMAGHVGVPTGSGYSASKFALEGFFSAVRPELVHKGVGVLVVEPGGMSHGDTSTRAMVNANGDLGVPLPGSRCVDCLGCSSFVLAACIIHGCVGGWVD